MDRRIVHSDFNHGIWRVVEPVDFLIAVQALIDHPKGNWGVASVIINFDDGDVFEYEN